MNEINENFISTNAKPIFEKYGFKKVALFGSRARGDYKTESDIDLIYSTDKKMTLLDLISVEDELELYFGVKVDLLNDKKVISRMRPQILKDLKIIYEK